MKMNGKKFRYCQSEGYGKICGTPPQFNSMEEKLHFQIRQLSHRHHHGEGKGGQFRVLAVLNEQGDMSQKALMEMLDIRSASLSELLFKVEDRGWIERARSAEDKRNVDVHLTEEGKAVVAAMDAKRGERRTALFANFTDEEKEALSKLLEKLLANMETMAREFPRPDGHPGRHGNRHGGHGRHHQGGRSD